MSVENGNGFDRWLEQQLHAEAGSAGGPTPDPSQSQYHAAYLQGGLHMSVLAKAASMVSTKGAVGLAVAALAIGGVSAEAAVTGSANPSDWGSQVVKQVQACKAVLSPGSHGIGQCVSAFAKQNGPAVSSDHRASGARTHSPGPPVSPGKPANPGKPTNVPPTGKP